MRRNPLFFHTWYCFLILISLALQSQASNPIGNPYPLFSLDSIQGETYQNNDWQGKTVILNFWATWCKPCAKEIPLLNKIHHRYRKNKVIIQGIALDNKKSVLEFNQKIPIEYQNLLGGKAGFSLIKTFGNASGILPFTVIITPDGRIDSTATGLLTENFLVDKINAFR